MVPLPAMLLLNPFPTHIPQPNPAPFPWPHYHSPTRPIMMMMPLFQPLTFPTSRPPCSQHPPLGRPFLLWLALMSIKIIMCSCCRTAKLLLLLLKFGISYSFPYAWIFRSLSDPLSGNASRALAQILTTELVWLAHHHPFDFTLHCHATASASHKDPF